MVGLEPRGLGAALAASSVGCSLNASLLTAHRGGSGPCVTLGLSTVGYLICEMGSFYHVSLGQRENQLLRVLCKQQLLPLASAFLRAYDQDDHLGTGGDG